MRGSKCDVLKDLGLKKNCKLNQGTVELNKLSLQSVDLSWFDSIDSHGSTNTYYNAGDKLKRLRERIENEENEFRFFSWNTVWTKLGTNQVF